MSFNTRGKKAQDAVVIEFNVNRGKSILDPSSCKRTAGTTARLFLLLQTFTVLSHTPVPFATWKKNLQIFILVFMGLKSPGVIWSCCPGCGLKHYEYLGSFYIHSGIPWLGHLTAPLFVGHCTVV